MVEVPAAGHEDLVLVDIQQRSDDVVGDRSGLHRQRPVAGQSQRIHPERRAAQVEEPHPLGAIRGGCPQTDVGELALGIDHDRGGVGRHDVVGVKGDQGGGLAAALAADQQCAVSAVVRVNDHFGVLGAKHREQILGPWSVVDAHPSTSGTGQVPGCSSRAAAVCACAGPGGVMRFGVAGATAAHRLRGSGNPRQCHAPDRYALHPRGGQRE